MVTPYIASYVMLEEHRHNISRHVHDSGWSPAAPVQRGPGMVALRRRLCTVLHAIADRLDPHGPRSRTVQLVVMPYPENQAGTGKEAWG